MKNVFWLKQNFILLQLSVDRVFKFVTMLPTDFISFVLPFLDPFSANSIFGRKKVF